MRIVNFLKCGLFCTLFSAVNVSAVEITLLVAYDDYTKNRFDNDVRAAMQSWVDGVNQIYETSQVDLQLKLAHIVNHNPVGEDMKEVLRNVLNAQTLKELRNQHKADFVTQVHKKGKCGLGYLTLKAAYAYNIVGPQCGYLTLAHELGHNMGLHHSRKQGNDSGHRYRYGLGYGVEGSFTTIMAYPSAFNTKNRQARFSNPDIICQGLPCGVAIEDTNEAFAAQALNNVKHDIANHRMEESKTPLNELPSDEEYFGLRYINDSSAMLYHVDKGWDSEWHVLCLGNECRSGVVNEGFYERLVSVSPNNNYTINFYIQDDTSGRCSSGKTKVTYTKEGGSASSNCQ